MAKDNTKPSKKDADTQKKIENIVKLANDSIDKYKPMLERAKKCVDYYTGDQDRPRANQEAAGTESPSLIVNHIRKPVDVVAGYVQQNKTDLRCFPIGSRDSDTADTLSKYMKWLFDDCSGHFQTGKACKDAIMGGIGWVQAYLDYNEDFMNGDIIVDYESPFRIYPDPVATKPDFSDARFMLRIDFLDLEEAKSKWPEVSSDLEAVTKGTDTDRLMDLQKPQTNEESDLVKVVEFWHMEWEKKAFIIEGEQVIWLDEKQVKDAKAMGKEVVERRVRKLCLTILLNDKVIAYDGYSPYGVDRYPFVPYMFYYTPSADKWEKKVQGIVYDLKEIQDEVNKYRQKAMQSALSMPDAGYMFEEGAVEDESCFYTKAPGGMTLVKARPGQIDRIRPLNPRQISPQMLEAMQTSKNDIREVGPNADLMGMKQESGSPGVAIQLRQQQGVIAIQDPFENFSKSNIALGKLLLEYIRVMPIEKIADVCELDEIPEGFQRFMDGLSRFDCKVDEVNVSPTTRMIYQMEIQQLEQGGVVVPAEVKIENSNLPKKTKDTLLMYNNQIQQVQQMQQQLQAQMQGQQS